jgi:hypothetical protein
MAVHLSGKPALNVTLLLFGASDRVGPQTQINRVSGWHEGHE